jgi:murein DD-endopeptidase MepM/ murein hydrolase activator NlpD|tara:strand:- start:11426 stop:12283 length:858 start_codon:yes stop_codon:yes gene_type:complete
VRRFSALLLALGVLLSASVTPTVGASGSDYDSSIVEADGPVDTLVFVRSTGLAPLVTAAGRIGLVAQEGITEATDRLGLLSGIVADLGSRNRAAVEALDVANRLLAEQFHGAVEVRSTYQAIVEQLDESDRRRLEEATRTRRNTSAVVRVVNSTEWICPVVGVTRFIDTWGEARSGNRTHEGVDIAAPSNTPVVAPVSGRVTYRWDSIGGRSFDLVADNGDYYFGTHLRRFGIEGRVAAGDNIGFVGSDGNADANILHLEYHPGGRGNPVNPYPLAYAHCDRSNG